MNLDPEDSQIHILLIIYSLSLSLSLSLSPFFFCFPRKPAELDEKSEELNSVQECVLTDWWSSFPNMGVWTGKQPLATSDIFESWMPIGQEAHMIRSRWEGRICKEEKSDKLVGREMH